MNFTKKTFRLGGLLLVACLISSVMLSGTFAKYTSEVAGQDTALVAKWSLTMTDGATAFTSPATAELNLFSHAYNTDIIATDGTAYLIAPGVQGQFSLDLTNSSDVAANITFDITKTGANVPMEYSIDKAFGAPGAVILNGDGALKTALNTAAIKLDVAGAATDHKDMIVYWRWAFDGTTATAGATDVTDTTLGTDSAAGTGLGAGNRTTYNLKINITATQVTPS